LACTKHFIRNDNYYYTTRHESRDVSYLAIEALIVRHQTVKVYAWHTEKISLSNVQLSVV